MKLKIDFESEKDIKDINISIVYEDGKEIVSSIQEVIEDKPLIQKGVKLEPEPPPEEFLKGV